MDSSYHHLGSLLATVFLEHPTSIAEIELRSLRYEAKFALLLMRCPFIAVTVSQLVDE